MISTPGWVKDAVFYQIFPDRFAQSGRVPKPSNLEPWDAPPTPYGFKGGDLLGVAERLDYLADLGITAIYFNPIFRSAANHRYHTHDYYRVDPILGGNDAFRELLDAAHARGMRILLDGVFNHTGRGFYQFHHLLENGSASPYLDWFSVDVKRLGPGKGPDGYPSWWKRRGLPGSGRSLKVLGYRAWWDLPALPKLNTDNPVVRQFIFDVARHWVRFGIDGWRLDVPGEIDDDRFWREFRRVVKGTNPEAYLVGEIWHEAQRWLRGDQFDGVMNYPLTRACLGFFGGDGLDTGRPLGGYPLRPLDGIQFADEIDRLLGLYDWEITLSQLNLLDSHDMPRFLTLVGGDRDALRLAVLFLMTFPGVPCIYYGDEVGMEGKHDPDCRRGFPWDKGRWDHELLAFFRRAIGLRRAHPALRHGRFVRLYADPDVYAFARQGDRETLIVVLNNGTGEWQGDLPLHSPFPSAPPPTTRPAAGGRPDDRDSLPLLSSAVPLTDLWGDCRARVAEGRIRGLRLPPRSAAILAAGGPP